MPGTILYVPAQNLRNPVQAQNLASEGFAWHQIRQEEVSTHKFVTEPCVILLEMEVYDLDFIRAWPAIRSRISSFHIPIVALVGSARSPYAHDAIRQETEALDSGIDVYLQKPVSIRKLATRIRVLLRRTRYFS